MWKNAIHRVLDTAFAALSPEDLADVALSLTGSLTSQLDGPAGQAVASDAMAVDVAPPPPLAFAKGPGGGEAEEEVEAVVDPLDPEDVRALAQRREVQAAAEAMVAAHAAGYVARNGAEASFAGWIATFHPENVVIDARLTSPDGRYAAIWRQAVAVDGAASPPPPPPPPPPEPTVGGVGERAGDSAAGAAKAGPLEAEVAEVAEAWGGWGSHLGLIDAVLFLALATQIMVRAPPAPPFTRVSLLPPAP